MTFPHRPGPAPGHFRPSPPPSSPPQSSAPAQASRGDSPTGHPAVDAVLQALANAAQLPPAEQIAEYEAAHQTLQETLASIDR